MSDINQPSTAQLLELVSVQMASEAFIVKKDKDVNSQLDEALTTAKLQEILEAGNGHSTKFTSVAATDFVSKWEVKAHQANTSTGFSGTLFQAKQDIAGTTIKTGDPKYCGVISFRSTEFIQSCKLRHPTR